MDTKRTKDINSVKVKSRCMKKSIVSYLNFAGTRFRCLCSCMSVKDNRIGLENLMLKFSWLVAAWEIICYLLVNCHQYNLRVEYCYLRSVKVKTSSSFDPSSIYVQCKLHGTLWHDCGRLDTSFACEVWLKSLISQHKCVMIIIDHTTISSFYSF